MTIKGHTEPRIFTPPLRELTPETSLGFSVIEFADKVLGQPLYAWQEWLVIHALEIVGDLEVEWHFRFRYVVVLVSRQNGKTFLGEVLALWWQYILEAPLVIGTAQSLDIAEEVWQGAVSIAENNRSLKREIEKVSRTNGKKELRLKGGRRYKVQAATRKGGRGLTGDLVLLDELREHQNWEAWAAVSSTTLARPDALVWCMSNAGDATSVVLRHLRLQAHKLLGDPDGVAKNLALLGGPEDGAEVDNAETLEDTAMGLFEWSGHPNCSLYDEEEWAWANPSMNIGGITTRALKAAAATYEQGKFRTECLCQWIEATLDPPFPAGAWEAGKDEGSQIAPDARLWWGVDISADRTHSAIAVCGLRSDRKPHLELVAYRTGTAWLTNWFSDPDRHAEFAPFNVVLQGRGAPVSAYAEILGAIDGVNVISCEGKNVAAYCGRLWDAVAACQEGSSSDAVPVRHRSQAALDMAANIAATKPLGDGAWGFDRNKSPEDISPLIAVAMAYGASTDVEKEEKKSSYETYEPVFL